MTQVCFTIFNINTLCFNYMTRPRDFRDMGWGFAYHFKHYPISLLWAPKTSSQVFVILENPSRSSVMEWKMEVNEQYWPTFQKNCYLLNSIKQFFTSVEWNIHLRALLPLHLRHCVSLWSGVSQSSCLTWGPGHICQALCMAVLPSP